MFLKIKSIIDDLNKYNTKKNYTTCIIDKQKIQAQEDKIKAKQDLYDFKLQARLDKLKEIENVKRFNNSIVYFIFFALC